MFTLLVLVEMLNHECLNFLFTNNVKKTSTLRVRTGGRETGRKGVGERRKERKGGRKEKRVGERRSKEKMRKQKK